MRKETRKGYTWSGALHIVVILLLITGLPSLFQTHQNLEADAITVEILPISEITNIKPSEKTPEKKKKEEPKKEEVKDEPKPEEKPAKKEEQKTVKETPKAEAPKPKPVEKPAEEETPVAKPEEKKPEEKVPEEKKKPVEKPKDKPKEEPKPKEEDKKEEVEDPMKALLDKLKKEKEQRKAEDNAASEEKEDSSSSKESRSNSYDPSLPMSSSEISAIKGQISKNWNLGSLAGAKGIEDLSVELKFQVSKSGKIEGVTVADSDRHRYTTDSFYRAFVDSALRAVNKTNTLKNLPLQKHNRWKDIELTFSPRDMGF